MAKFWKYSIGVLGVAVTAAVAYGSAVLYNHRLQQAYTEGLELGMEAVIENTSSINEDLNGDGLEDFCLIFPRDRDLKRKGVCYMDHDEDCVQDTVYAISDELNNITITTVVPGREIIGSCTINKRVWMEK